MNHRLLGTILISLSSFYLIQHEHRTVLAAEVANVAVADPRLTNTVKSVCATTSTSSEITCLTDLIDQLTNRKNSLSKQTQPTDTVAFPNRERQRGILDPVIDLFGNPLLSPQQFGIELFRSVEEDARPATFGWTRERGGESVYTVDSAFRVSKPGIVNGALNNKLFMDLNLAFEAHTSSAQQNREANSLKWSLGAQGVYHPESQKKRWSPADLRLIRQLGDFDPSELGTPGVNFLWITNAFYELNPSTRLAQAGGDISTSFNYFDLGVGRFLKGPANAFSFRWRPYLGFEAGGTVNKEDATNNNDSALARLNFRIRGDLVLDFLSNRVTASGDYQYWHLFTTSSHSRGLGTVSLNYKLTENAYLSGSYVEGRRPPSFGKVRHIGAELGVQY